MLSTPNIGLGGNSAHESSSSKAPTVLVIRGSVEEEFKTFIDSPSPRTKRRKRKFGAFDVSRQLQNYGDSDDGKKRTRVGMSTEPSPVCSPQHGWQPRLEDVCEIPEVSKKISSFLETADVLSLARTSRGLYDCRSFWQDVVSRRLPEVDICWPFMKPYQEAAYWRRIYFKRSHELMFVTAEGNEWLARHKSLRKSFFPILCNWLVELHFELFGDHTRKLQCKSPLNPIHLAMKYLYRFLTTCKDSITSNRLQLVGVSCYQIAIECTVGKAEVKQLGLDSARYAYYTDNAYTPEEVENMTDTVAASIQAGFSRSGSASRHCRLYTATDALDSLLTLTECDPLTSLFARYVTDLAMHTTGFSSVLPSRIAAAAVKFASTKTGETFPKRKVTYFCHEAKRNLDSTAELLRRLYEGACLQETGNQFNTRVLPKYSMVIKHYQYKFITWIHKKNAPSFKKSLFSNSTPNSL